MIHLGPLEFRSKKELLLYVFGSIALLHFLVNEVVLDGYLQLPLVLRVSLNVVGFLVFGAVCIGMVVFVVGKLTEGHTFSKGRTRDLLTALQCDVSILAPNLGAAERERVLDCLYSGLRDATITSAHAVVEEGEDTIQVIVLEGRDAKKLAAIWQELSDGARVINAKAAHQHYALRPSESVVEVVWD